MKLFLTDIAGNKNHNKIMFRNPCEKGRAKETITSVLFVCLFVLCLFLHKSKILIYLETLKKEGHRQRSMDMDPSDLCLNQHCLPRDSILTVFTVSLS